MLIQNAYDRLRSLIDSSASVPIPAEGQSPIRSMTQAGGCTAYRRVPLDRFHDIHRSGVGEWPRYSPWCDVAAYVAKGYLEVRTVLTRVGSIMCSTQDGLCVPDSHLARRRVCCFLDTQPDSTILIICVQNPLSSSQAQASQSGDRLISFTSKKIRHADPRGGRSSCNRRQLQQIRNWPKGPPILQAREVCSSACRKYQKGVFERGERVTERQDPAV